ncbi:glycosyltransferase family 2 protein [Tunturibacter empetritectus]|nr:glycosyltransferase family 2 protein [Edaphobacter lichenicola]
MTPVMGASFTKMTKITVAIPAYNAEPYLQEAIDSVLAQTCKPHEIIVVNDGSHDRTEEIALSYGSSIRYIKQENQGLSGARNTAIREASGDWIAFFDSDDVMLPEKLERQVKAIEDNPNLVLVYSAFTYLYENGSTYEMAAFPARQLWPALRYRTPILPSTSVIRRSALLDVGCFNAVPAEDWDLWLRLVRRYSSQVFQEVPESLILYRQVENSLSKRILNIASGSMEMLDETLVRDLSGIRKIVWKRRIEAKILFNVSVAMRENQNERYWAYAVESLLQWPFFGVIVPFDRYVIIANMVYKKLTSRRWDLGYWWPIRRCREELQEARRNARK